MRERGERKKAREKGEERNRENGEGGVL
jgi:hypothetical protein